MCPLLAAITLDPCLLFTVVATHKTVSIDCCSALLFGLFSENVFLLGDLFFSDIVIRSLPEYYGSTYARFY